MELIAQFVIVPLVLASLLTGLIQSFGTAWGLFRHYWVVLKLLLTLFAAAVLLSKLELIRYAARLADATTLSRPDLDAAGFQLLVHAAGGLLVLLVPALLSVYKPLGLTPYGRRNAHQRTPSQRPFGSNAATRVLLSRESPGSTTRWTYVFGAFVFVIVVHVVILHAAGIGLGRH